MRIDRARNPVRRPVEFGEPDHDLAGGARLLVQSFHQGVAVLGDAIGLLGEQARDLAQHIHEGGAAIARLFGKISPAPHRLALRCEEHRQRPAALLAEQVQGVHVDLVNVRPFLAVDLDVDEPVVHHARGRLILEALVRHHVTPVACRVADREQDRPVGALRLGQRLRSPGPPIDRIVLVMQQVGRGLMRETILMGGARCYGHSQSVARMARQRNPGCRGAAVRGNQAAQLSPVSPCAKPSTRSPSFVADHSPSASSSRVTVMRQPLWFSNEISQPSPQRLEAA